jgi:DNA-directed RNA polymerase subunit RPC12/RpoP
VPAEWYYKVLGQEVGPLTSAELRQHAANGRITRDAYIRKGNNGNWVSAETVKGLIASLRTQEDILIERSISELNVIPPPHLREPTTCENCGRAIGQLESAKDFNGHTVCQECENRLLLHARSTAAYRNTHFSKRGVIICPNPNCGYVGSPEKQARGSLVVGCLLTLIMILPGLIYFAFMSGYNYICPRCGVHIRPGTHN